MNAIEQLQDAFITFLKKKFNLNSSAIIHCKLELNVDESKQSFGNLSTNTPLILAKTIGQNPKQIAQEIAETFYHDFIEKIEVAGPGFLNFFLTLHTFQIIAQDLFITQELFFKPEKLAKKYNVSLEFVSANPTGPLHFGHGRGGIIGDVLGNILCFLGHTVAKEYYINDVGAQIKKLSESFKIRCFQAAGHQAELPEDAYHGEYLISVAAECFAEYGHTLFEKSDLFFQDYAKNYFLNQIKQTLENYGIYYDIWFSEKILYDDNEVKEALSYLKKKGLLYEKDGAEWFMSTKFGDDKDRVVRKASGHLTYIASDIAYLKNKIDRGFNKLIMILGHDHHSYVIRLHGVQQALDLDQYPLDIILYQLVKLTESGQLLRMSKRTGKIITLQDVINTVGTDVARFFYLNRKADAQLEFNLDLALKKTEENPVYYVQYAYVRTKSILNKAKEEAQLQNINKEDAQNLGTEELFLLKKIVSLKELLATINSNYHTHLLTYYILDLAQIFHRYYSKNRVINLDDILKSRARLLLIITLRNTFGLILKLIGISQPEKM
ncbi:MAG: arginine--tRNA ligase [Candidatus Babeliales bacterium]